MGRSWYGMVWNILYIMAFLGFNFLGEIYGGGIYIYYSFIKKIFIYNTLIYHNNVLTVFVERKRKLRLNFKFPEFKP